MDEISPPRHQIRWPKSSDIIFLDLQNVVQATPADWSQSNMFLVIADTCSHKLFCE